MQNGVFKCNTFRFPVSIPLRWNLFRVGLFAAKLFFLIQAPYDQLSEIARPAVFVDSTAIWASLLLKGLEQTNSKIQETCVQMQHVFIYIYTYIDQPGSWLELIFNPQISSDNGFFELINPGKLTCPLKRDNFNRKYIFQALIFKGHVSFPGSITTVDGQHLNCWQLQHGKYPKQSTVGFYYRSKLLHHLEFKRFVSLTEEWHNASLSIQIFTNIWWYMDLRLHVMYINVIYSLDMHVINK